jgi:hypothetical protein
MSEIDDDKIASALGLGFFVGAVAMVAIFSILWWAGITPCTPCSYKITIDKEPIECGKWDRKTMTFSGCRPIKTSSEN